MVPVQLPSIIFGRYCFFCSSVPRRINASTAPAVSIVTREKERFADFHISTTGVETIFGSPCPPCSAGACSAFQPASTNWRYASLKPLGVVTLPFSHFEPSLSAGLLSGESTPLANFALSSRIWSTSSALISSKPGSFATSARPAISWRTKCMSRSGALYSLIDASAKAVLSQLLHQFRNDLEQVSDDPIVRHLEYRRFLVLVDGDDDAAVLHTCQVLDRAGDSHGDVEFRRDDLAGLPDLPVVRHEPRVHRGARSPHRRAQLVGKRLENLEIITGSHAAPARHHHARGRQLGALGLGEGAADDRRQTRIRARLEGFHRARTAACWNRVEPGRPHRDDLDPVLRLHGREGITGIDRAYEGVAAHDRDDVGDLRQVEQRSDARREILPE